MFIVLRSITYNLDQITSVSLAGEHWVHVHTNSREDFFTHNRKEEDGIALAWLFGDAMRLNVLLTYAGRNGVNAVDLNDYKRFVEAGWSDIAGDMEAMPP